MAERDFPELDTQTDTSLRELDFDQLRQDRLDRNKKFMQVNKNISI